MLHYKLLTPGPLTTTATVKQQMMDDHCTWDEDYKKITRAIREKLLELAHVSEPEYTTVLIGQRHIRCRIRTDQRHRQRRCTADLCQRCIRQTYGRHCKTRRHFLHHVR